jgi:hypothetical protein
MNLMTSRFGAGLLVSLAIAAHDARDIDKLPVFPASAK